MKHDVKFKDNFKTLIHWKLLNVIDSLMWSHFKVPCTKDWWINKSDRLLLSFGNVITLSLSQTHHSNRDFHSSSKQLVYKILYNTCGCEINNTCTLDIMFYLLWLLCFAFPLWTPLFPLFPDPLGLSISCWTADKTASDSRRRVSSRTLASSRRRSYKRTIWYKSF